MSLAITVLTVWAGFGPLERRGAVVRVKAIEATTMTANVDSGVDAAASP